MIDIRCVYALVDPRDGRTYYVGEAKDPMHRLMRHFSEAVLRRGVNPEKDEWLYDLLLNALNPPILEVLAFAPATDIYAAERAWVERLLSEGEPLLNRKYTDKAVSPETRARLRAAHLGRKLSVETREKMRQSRLRYLDNVGDKQLELEV